MKEITKEVLTKSGEAVGDKQVTDAIETFLQLKAILMATEYLYLVNLVLDPKKEDLDLIYEFSKNND